MDRAGSVITFPIEAGGDVLRPGFNHVPYSENLGTGWSPRGAASVANVAGLNPRGVDGTWRFSPATSTGYIAIPILGGNFLNYVFTVSVWLRASDANPKDVIFGLLREGDSGSGVATAVTLSQNWKRFVLTGPVTSTTTSLHAYVQSQGNTTPFDVFGFDVKIQADLTGYVPTLTTGLFGLFNARQSPMDRFSNWVPLSRPIGPQETALGTGQRFVFPFRTDHTATFEIRGIPNTLLDVMLQLVDRLERGSTVAVYTGDSLASIYPTCCLAPDSHPSIQLSDARNLEYTFSVTLLNVAAVPVRMIAVY